MDVDVYSDDGSTKIDVKGMKANIQIVLGRMKSKNPALVTMLREFNIPFVIFFIKFSWSWVEV